MKKAAHLIACTTLLSTANFANTHDVQRAHVIELLNQPLTTQVYCARAGYLGYQNALSGVYMAGLHGVKKDPIKAYTWALIADYQIKKTHDEKLIGEQTKTLAFISTKMQMTPMQKRYAQWQANYIIHHHHRNWPTPTTLLSVKSYPSPCAIA